MTSSKSPDDLAKEWKDACNSYDIDRIMGLYAEDVMFKSPRVRKVSRVASGMLRGKSAVRDYWRRIFERRPDLSIAVGKVFAGVDSVVLEYRVGEGLYGIEFMTVDADGLVTFAVGNDLVQP